MAGQPPGHADVVVAGVATAEPVAFVAERPLAEEGAFAKLRSFS